MKKDKLTYTVIFSFAITFVFVFILSLLYQSTKGKVEENAKIAEAKAFLIASGYGDIATDKAEDLFEEKFKKTDTENVWFTKIGGKIIYVSKFQGNALWGSVEGVFATNKDINRIIGLRITNHSETPGLGGRIEEDWFLDQLKGEKLDKNFRVIMGSGKGDYNPDNGYIDGITGATRTSESIEKIVLNEYKTLKDNLGGE